MNCKRLLAVLVMLLLINSITAFAQEKVVTGRVTDSKDGSPLANVTVQVKGGKAATQTTNDGSFKIKVPGPKSILVVSSVGYNSRLIDATGAEISVSLVQSDASLSEVVVIGYGVQRKRDVTGAISRVSGDKISSVPGPSFEAALQGKAPGVQVIQGNGLAGSGSVIRIRGVGSISASSDPLYVIDGIPFIADQFLRGNSGAMNQNPLASINPNDIESIEVLKDAGATGIYGSRGANGVILVTTKRGKAGKPSFTYSTKLGGATYSKKLNFVNGAEWLQLRQEAWFNSGNTGKATLPDGITYAKADSTNTDWWDLLTRTGFIDDHSISMTQGNKKLKTFANLTYGNEAGYLKNNSYERISARLNLDYLVSSKVKVSLTSGYNRGVNHRVNASYAGGIGDAMSSALPIYPVYNADGTYFTAKTNPVRVLNESQRREISNRLLGGLSLEYQPINNLFLKAAGSIEYVLSSDDQYQTNVLTQKSVADSGYASRSPYWGTNWTTTYTANYLWNPTNDHKFNFLLGAEAQEENLKDYSIGINASTNKPFYQQMGLYNHLVDSAKANTPGGINHSKDQYTFNSFFARVNYIYKGRYAFQAVGRIDGSSKFGSNYKHGFFPALSAGWTISDESFMKPIRQINFLKLRASYGIVGNANYPNGSYQDDYQGGGITYNGHSTLYLNRIGNPNLHWETLHNVDVAVEFALFGSRVTGEIAYYHKTTTNILLQPGVATSAGIPDIWRNLDNSKILNQGVEFNANVKIIDKKDLKWAVGGNIAKNQNKVLEYELGPDAVKGGTNDTRIVKGLPVGVNFLVRYHGVDPTDGLPIWLDQNGKQTKTFSLNHRVYAGSVMPDYIGGFNTSLNYKNFDFSVLFSYVIGGKIYENSGKYQFLGVTQKFWNFRKDFLDRWTKPGDVTQYPKLLASATDYPGVPSEDQFNSTMFLRDASYLRLRELSVGYRIPRGTLGKSFLKDVRLFLTGTNLLTFTKYPGGDPEITRDFENPQDRNLSPNVTYLTAPSQKTFIFGMNVNF
ncbi:SusC/RagA family TonB-linked outer membrane protein [Parasediminibacterium sp. JCM 36343]|uniref:SusC/RagA family TonB-linked outer membrane protein n=1 Tax=Parasediminibacterium sp. JCM 36343 TaxID=3374279 RepID=UPI00397AB8CD